MWKVLSDKTLTSLAKALDAASLRQQVAAHNIANLNTPGFKRSTVIFEELLQQVLAEREDAAGGASPSLARLKPEVVKDLMAESMRADGNNVDLEAEMSLLTQNSINYNTATQLLNSKLARLKYVINEGRR